MKYNVTLKFDDWEGSLEDWNEINKNKALLKSVEYVEFLKQKWDKENKQMTREEVIKKLENCVWTSPRGLALTLEVLGLIKFENAREQYCGVPLELYAVHCVALEDLNRHGYKVIKCP